MARSWKSGREQTVALSSARWTRLIWGRVAKDIAFALLQSLALHAVLQRSNAVLQLVVWHALRVAFGAKIRVLGWSSGGRLQGDCQRQHRQNEVHRGHGSPSGDGQYKRFLQARLRQTCPANGAKTPSSATQSPGLTVRCDVLLLIRP